MPRRGPDTAVSFRSADRPAGEQADEAGGGKGCYEGAEDQCCGAQAGDPGRQPYSDDRNGKSHVQHDEIAGRHLAAAQVPTRPRPPRARLRSPGRRGWLPSRRRWRRSAGQAGPGPPVPQSRCRCRCRRTAPTAPGRPAARLARQPAGTPPRWRRKALGPPAGRACGRPGRTGCRGKPARLSPRSRTPRRSR